MMKIEDLIDIDSKYSSTRWVLVVCVKAGIAISIFSVFAYCVLKFLKKDIDNSFLTSVSVLVGVIIGLPATLKGSQSFAEHNGHEFETNDNKKDENK